MVIVNLRDIAGAPQIFHKNFFVSLPGKFSLEKKNEKSFYEKFAGSWY
jgi:hypothetical protein